MYSYLLFKVYQSLFPTDNPECFIHYISEFSYIFFYLHGFVHCTSISKILYNIFFWKITFILQNLFQMLPLYCDFSCLGCGSTGYTNSPFFVFSLGAPPKAWVSIFLRIINKVVQSYVFAQLSLRDVPCSEKYWHSA